jgi:uncharacterized protein
MAISALLELLFIVGKLLLSKSTENGQKSKNNDNAQNNRSGVENSCPVRQNLGMQLVKSTLLLCVLVLLAGCQKPADQAPATPPVVDDEPTQAQPKLPTIKLYIGPVVLDAEMAVTYDEERTGMMFRTNIQDSDAMIFVFPTPQQVGFWMKNCPESISCAYITADGTIAEIHHLEHDDTNTVYSATSNIQFVLETQEGWFAHHNIPVGTGVSTEKGTLTKAFLQPNQP